MADEDTTTDTKTQPDPSATDNDQLGDAGKRALDSERAARRDADQKAKDAETRAAALEKDLAKIRRQTLSDGERAIDEARTAGRSEAAIEFGKRLARAEFDSLAGRRNPDAATDDLLEYVDLTKFVGEDGEPDSKAIKAAVERLVPEKSSDTTAPPSLDLGPRSTSTRGKSTGDLFAATIEKLL